MTKTPSGPNLPAGLPLAVIIALAAAAPAVHGQAARMIAGWDFSQFIGDGITSLDGASYATSVPANYSDLDPNGLGAESAAFGTLYFDGSNGSTPADPSSNALPYSFNLGNNLNPGSFGYPFNSAGSYAVLLFEGQPWTQDLSFTVTSGFGGGDGDLVFGAVPGGLARNWSLKFSAKTTQPGTMSVGILFSRDGVTYASVGTASITAIDTLFSFSVADNASVQGYWKLDFAGIPATVNPVIDNVSIHAQILALPLVAATVSGPDLLVSCQGTYSGVNYKLQSSGTLEPLSWSDVETRPGANGGIVFTRAKPAPGTRVFYRVEMLPAP